MTASCFSTPLAAPLAPGLTSGLTSGLKPRLGARLASGLPGVLPAPLPAVLPVALRRRRSVARGSLWLLPVLALLLGAALLAPEQPLDQAAICQRHNGVAACQVW